VNLDQVDSRADVVLRLKDSPAEAVGLQRHALTEDATGDFVGTTVGGGFQYSARRGRKDGRSTRSEPCRSQPVRLSVPLIRKADWDFDREH